MQLDDPVFKTTIAPSAQWWALPEADFQPYWRRYLHRPYAGDVPVSVPATSVHAGVGGAVLGIVAREASEIVVREAVAEPGAPGAVAAVDTDVDPGALVSPFFALTVRVTCASAVRILLA